MIKNLNNMSDEEILSTFEVTSEECCENTELFYELDKEFPNSVLDDCFMSVKEATFYLFAGVGACSPQLYQIGLEKISELTGRELDDSLRKEIKDCLNELPCPLD
jgi:hypothetical protein